MSFNPEDKFPKNGEQILNSSGEQYDISNHNFDYHDGLENTTKIKDSSVDNLFATKEAAQARAEQIGCGGYHTTTIDNVVYYMPCSDPAYYVNRMEQLESALNFTYIGSYRILSYDTPFYNVTKFNGWIIDCNHININSNPTLDAQDISIDFRYSIDGKTWSLWTNIGTSYNGLSNDFHTIILDPNNKFYPEFRFTSVLVNDDGTIIYNTEEAIDPTIVIVDFDLDIEYSTNIPEKIYKKPVSKCSSEYSNKPVIFDNCNFTFNPYNVNKALNLYQDLSKMVNSMFGLEANYYSIQPQVRGKDIVLKEYTLFNVVDEKCIKIVVPQNQFPDNKLSFDPFGIQFDMPFEVQIDKRYFETIFGKGSQPRKRDIIYFPITNRIYEINSTYLFRDFLNAPVYFKIELQKYSPRSNTYFQDPAYKEELEGITVSNETLFGAEIKDEGNKISNTLQHTTTINQMSQDPNRSYIYKDLPILEYDLNNNWTIISNHYYDLNSAFIDNSDFTYEPYQYRNAIRYKINPVLNEGSELAYTAWFSFKNFYDNSKLSKRNYPVVNMVLESYDDNFLIFNTYPFKHKLSKYISHETNPEGYVAIKGDKLHSGGFEVIESIDEYKFKVANKSNTFSDGVIQWKMQKAQSRNLLSGLYYNQQTNKTEGIRMDLIHSGITDEAGNLFLQEGSLIIKLNDTTINNRLQFIPEYGDWYGIVINISNIYKQIATNIWGMSYDPLLNSNDQTSKLNKLHSDSLLFNDKIIFSAPTDIELDKESPFYLTDNNSYKIYTSPLNITNIRLFKNMIDIDMQSTILNQNIVRDSHLAYIADNAKPLLNIPKFARNR